MLDVLHREALEDELRSRGLEPDEAGEERLAELTGAWHRLDPWPDVVEGLARLKRRHRQRGSGPPCPGKGQRPNSLILTMPAPLALVSGSGGTSRNRLGQKPRRSSIEPSSAAPSLAAGGRQLRAAGLPPETGRSNEPCSTGPFPAQCTGLNLPAPTSNVRSAEFVLSDARRREAALRQQSIRTQKLDYREILAAGTGTLTVPPASIGRPRASIGNALEPTLVAATCSGLRCAMTSNGDFEAAAAMGRKNSRTLVLAKNWCAHIRMTRFGGCGMIEQMTGDPIGHLGLECDHAGRDGMSCWDLADAAIDFYDRHCSVCTVRKPVGLPNLSELIGKRDRQAAERAREQQRLEAEATVALAERRQRRDQLQSGLSTLSATIVDDIDVFDADRSEANFKRLTESARLAPEHFPQALTDYVLDLARAEDWFRPAALAMLRHVGAPPRALVDLARKSLGASADLASAILIDHVSLLTPDDLRAVVPRAADRANPDGSRSYGTSPESDPALLLSLHQAHPEGVIDVLKAELGERSRYRVERGARGFRAIQKVSPTAADGAARDPRFDLCARPSAD